MGNPNMDRVHTLDLNFLGLPAAIAVYLIPHSRGAALIECGPGSTLQTLIAGLREFNLKPENITDVFLTHIHLDHGGSAGWWARQGARIHVHPIGAPHLADPAKLLSSAQRIYGDQMDNLWGEFLSVPEERLIVHEDGETVEIEDLSIKVIETPGHAYHHFVYIFNETCFTGDIGGIRVAESRHIRLPMPPPEFHLELWRESLQKILNQHKIGSIKTIAPTHFGLYTDAGWHLGELLRLVDEIDSWIDQVMPTDPTIEELNASFLAWTQNRSMRLGITEAEVMAFEAANPSWMSAGGIHRYWHKVRQPAIGSRPPGT